jgi:phenylacetate-CoA ligase
MEHNGIDDLTPNNIWTYSEILYEFQRKLIEKQFNCEVFDWFGFRESSMYMFECSEHTGYHVAAENGIIEILQNGSHVSTGELGAVVLTDLTNFATPLIRYVTEDLAIYSGKLCPCGRGLPIIAESIDGRFSDCISRSKGFVLPRSIVSLFSDIESIRDFQVIQKTRERIVVEVVREENYSANDTNFIINSLQKLIGSDANIEVEFVDSILLTASGKKRFVISETPPKFVSGNNTDIE